MTIPETTNTQSSSIIGRIIIALLAITALGALVFFTLRALKPYAFHGVVLQSPQPAQDFTLTNQYGQKSSLSDYYGKVVLIYFGYVACPDVCPTTLLELKRARTALGDRADEVQVIMITVDPERDTVEVMAEYLTHFDPSYIGLVGTPEETAQVATQYGVFFQKQETDSAVGYLVDHTATVMLIDPNGYLRLVFPYGTEGKDIAEDILYVLDH